MSLKENDICKKTLESTLGIYIYYNSKRKAHKHAVSKSPPPHLNIVDDELLLTSKHVYIESR